MIQGNRQQLAGKIQEYYGVTKENAEKQIEDFLNSLPVSQATEDKKARRAGHR